MEGLFFLLLSPRALEEKEMGSQPFSLIKYTQSVRVGVRGEEGGTARAERRTCDHPNTRRQQTRVAASIIIMRRRPKSQSDARLFLILIIIIV